LLSWIEKKLQKSEKTISKKDTKIYHLVDTKKEALEILKK